MQQIEVAVGEPDAPAAMAPALRLFHGLLVGDDFSQRAVLRRQRGEHIGLPHHRCPHLADGYSRRQVRQPHRHRQRKLCRQGRPKRSQSRVPCPGGVEHIRRLGRKMLRAVGIHQCHAVIAARHDHGAEPVLGPQCCAAATIAASVSTAMREAAASS